MIYSPFIFLPTETQDFFPVVEIAVVSILLNQTIASVFLFLSISLFIRYLRLLLLNHQLFLDNENFSK